MGVVGLLIPELAITWSMQDCRLAFDVTSPTRGEMLPWGVDAATQRPSRDSRRRPMMNTFAAPLVDSARVIIALTLDDKVNV